MSVLAVLDAERYDRLVTAGHWAGRWGRPWQIDPWSADGVTREATRRSGSPSQVR